MACELSGSTGETAPLSAVAQKGLDGMARILVVEDEAPISDMLARRLRKRGFEVEVAADGVAGVAAAVAVPPDLILMDITMPNMDGWEANSQIKKAEHTSAVPIVALSASEHLRDKCLEAGFREFELKPIDLPRLLAKMESLLRGRTEGEQD